MSIGCTLSYLDSDYSRKFIESLNITAIQMKLSRLNVWEQKSRKNKYPIDNIEGKFRTVHGKYLYNLCSPSFEKLSILNWEMNEANFYNSSLIIHCGSNKPEFQQSTEEACEMMAKHITKALKTGKGKICIENSSHEGNKIGHSIEELNYIYRSIDSSVRDRVSFCIDTCHIFASGEYKFKDEETVLNFYDKFDRVLGVENLSCVHLNDSQRDFNCRTDKHANLMCGYHFKNNREGLEAFVKTSAELQIPMILETPGSKYVDDLKLLNEILGRKIELCGEQLQSIENDDNEN
jgi:apurinic endonuclease APN1